MSLREAAQARGDLALRDGMYTAQDDIRNMDGHEAERDPEGWARASVAYRVGYQLIYDGDSLR